MLCCNLTRKQKVNHFCSRCCFRTTYQQRSRRYSTLNLLISPAQHLGSVDQPLLSVCVLPATMASRTNYKRFCLFILCIIVLVAVYLLVDLKWVRAAMIITSPDMSDPKPGSVTGSPDRTYPKPFNTTGSADRTYPMPAAKPDSSDGSDPNPRTPPPVPADVHLDPIKKVNGPNRLNPNPGDAPERLPLHRNLYSQEAWPAVQYPRDLLPGRVSRGPLTTIVAFVC